MIPIFLKPPSAPEPEFEESLSDILVGIGVAFAIIAVMVAELGLWSVERGNVRAEAALTQMRSEVRAVVLTRTHPLSAPTRTRRIP